MAPGYGFAEAALQRRALLGLLGDDNDETSTSTGTGTATGTAATTATTGGGGLLGGLTSAVGDVTSALGGIGGGIGGRTSSTPSSSTSSTRSTVSSTSSSSSTTSVTSTSTSSTISSTTSSSTTSSTVSTSSASTSSTPESTPQPVSQSEATTTYLSTSDNQVITITATRQVSAIVTSSAESETATPAGTQKSFLQNKPLSGTVFAFVGLIGLVIIILLSTWFLRRARRNRLEREAEAFSDTWPNADTGAVVDEKRTLARTPSDRTARSNTGSDQALVGGAGAVAAGSGGYGHRQQLSDGTIKQGLSSPPPQQYSQMQTQQGVPAMGMGTGMNAFNPLPPPPGLTGARSGSVPPPSMQQQGYGGYGGYESPYAAYQQPAYMPPQQHQANLQRSQTNGSAWSGPTAYGAYQQQQQQYQPQMNVNTMPPQSQGQGQGYGYVERASDGSVGSTPSPTNRGPPSVFGHKSSGSGSGSGMGIGTTGGSGSGEQQQKSDVRASASSDAYADYAFATGPGQNGSQPRNLTIANA